MGLTFTRSGEPQSSLRPGRPLICHPEISGDPGNVTDPGYAKDPGHGTFQGHVKDPDDVTDPGPDFLKAIFLRDQYFCLKVLRK